MKLSSIQISEEFKEVLRSEKQENETFESYIKRLFYSIERSIECKNKSIEMSIDRKLMNGMGEINKRVLDLRKITPDILKGNEHL